MKSDQLREYNKRNIFLEKSYTKCGGGTISAPFFKKSKLRISLNKCSKVLYSLFLFYSKLRAIQIYWNQAAYHLLLSHIKLFYKNKKGLNLFSLPHFPHDLWRNIFLLLYSVNYPNFIGWLTAMGWLLWHWTRYVLNLLVCLWTL